MRRQADAASAVPQQQQQQAQRVVRRSSTASPAWGKESAAAPGKRLPGSSSGDSQRQNSAIARVTRSDSSSLRTRSRQSSVSSSNSTQLTNEDDNSSVGSAASSPVVAGKRFCDSSASRDTGSSGGARVKVAVRVRPFSADELRDGAKGIISMQNESTRILDPTYFDSLKSGEADSAALRQVCNVQHCLPCRV
jgi:hypothetical protein